MFFQWRHKNLAPVPEDGSLIVIVKFRQIIKFPPSGSRCCSSVKNVGYRVQDLSNVEH